MQEIKITIGKNGKVNLDVAGVKGSACSDLTKSIEKALGRVEVTKKKSEVLPAVLHRRTQPDTRQLMARLYQSYSSPEAVYLSVDLDFWLEPR